MTNLEHCKMMLHDIYGAMIRSVPVPVSLYMSVSCDCVDVTLLGVDRYQTVTKYFMRELRP